MLNLDIYKVLREIILTVTGCPVVIRSNPNAPSPDGEYCAVSVSQPVTQRGQAIVRTKNTAPVTSPIGDVVDVEFDVRSQLIMSASCNFYRGEAHQYARQLFQANKRPDIQALLFTNKIGWNGCEPVNNLNALQSEDWENRAQVTVRLMFEDSSVIDNNAIYSASATVENEDGDILEEFDIESPNP
jgi:hypothetical protein